MTNIPAWTAELERIASILKKAPLESTIKWGSEVLTYDGKNVVSYGGFKNYFALWFYNGVFLEDRHKVLVNAQEGKTKSLRQWRFTTMEEIDEEKILQYVMEAIEVEKKGLKIKPAAFKAIPVPLLLEMAFETKDSLKEAFEKLTPGKQKEYIVYLEEAKQEKTRISRLDKIIPMILEGKGLNDKYK